LVGQGMTPIVAHPERHDYFRNEPDRLRALTAAGAWIQITVDSLLGGNSSRVAAAAEEFLKEFPAAVLATDAHNPRRCSGLSPGYRRVKERLGPARADELRERSDQILRTLLAERGTMAGSKAE
jgi:protein-tyrosine phosphatase